MKKQDVRLGSVLEYWGNVPGYRNKRGIVTAIDNWDNKDNYLLRVRKSDGEFAEVRTYQGEFMPVTLDKAHLVQLGFTKEQSREVYSLYGKTAVRPQFITYYRNGTDFDDLGFFIFDNQLPEPLTKESVQETGVDVSAVHYLQNYYADKLGITLDGEQFL